MAAASPPYEGGVHPAFTITEWAMISGRFGLCSPRVLYSVKMYLECKGMRFYCAKGADSDPTINSDSFTFRIIIIKSNRIQFYIKKKKYIPVFISL